MRYEDEIKILEYLEKGRGANNSLRQYQKSLKSEKYSHYRKSFLPAPIPERKIKDMLLTASHKTQAIFKISSYGKGQGRALSHLRYISRHGKLALEDQDGQLLQNSKERKELIKGWSIDFGTNSRSRDTMHLVLSSPPGTNREHMKSAARVFLEKEYKSSGHDYVFVAHEDTDHPHVHAMIKMVSHHGHKLNPRKAYLRQVRERFAETCRSFGIDVEASSRCERGLSGSSKRSEFIQMKKTQRRPYVDRNLVKKIKEERQLSTIMRHPSEDKMLQRNQIIRKRYAEKAKSVAAKAAIQHDAVTVEKYRKAANLLDEYAKTMPLEQSRGDKLYQQFLKKFSSTRDVTYDEESFNQAQSFDQYEAVTKGLKNGQDIYVSPQKLLNKKIGELLNSQDIHTDRENIKGLEID